MLWSHVNNQSWTLDFILLYFFLQGRRLRSEYPISLRIIEEFLVPRSSRSRTFFHSSIPRGIDSITPRILDSSPKFHEDLEHLRYDQKGHIHACICVCIDFHFQNTFQNDVFLQNFLLLAVWDNFFHWNINDHIKVSYILFWIFLILLWKTFYCPCWVAEWNEKPIETHNIP